MAYYPPPRVYSTAVAIKPVCAEVKKVVDMHLLKDSVPLVNNEHRSFYLGRCSVMNRSFYLGRLVA